MDIAFSVTKKSIKPLIIWGTYIFFFLFCISLALESYTEYEYIAGNIFSVIAAVVGVIGIGIYVLLRIKHRKV